VADISINRIHEVGSIQILRTKTSIDGNNEYKIIEPKGFEEHVIEHNYDDRAYKLLYKVLKIIKEKM
ncbi:MAG: hypothetical protein ACW98W_20130, partial [Candidatus Hodarchaeales archaeon]